MKKRGKQKGKEAGNWERVIKEKHDGATVSVQDTEYYKRKSQLT